MNDTCQSDRIQDYAGRNRRIAAFPVYMVIEKEEGYRNACKRSSCDVAELTQKQWKITGKWESTQDEQEWKDGGTVCGTQSGYEVDMRKEF